MDKIANLLFEARMLKQLPRSGYAFLGAGQESVAEHSFMITFIAYVMSRMKPEADALKLVNMCLIHDLPEARTGDLNYVHKQYVTPDEESAVADSFGPLPFGEEMIALIREYNDAETLEARLAHDADQIAFIIDLKALSDIGYHPPDKWLPPVIDRLRTETGKKLAGAIMKTEWDAWWLKKLLLTGTDESNKE